MIVHGATVPNPVRWHAEVPIWRARCVDRVNVRSSCSRSVPDRHFGDARGRRARWTRVLLKRCRGTGATLCCERMASLQRGRPTMSDISTSTPRDSRLHRLGVTSVLVVLVGVGVAGCGSDDSQKADDSTTTTVAAGSNSSEQTPTTGQGSTGGQSTGSRAVAGPPRLRRRSTASRRPTTSTAITATSRTSPQAGRPPTRPR